MKELYRYALITTGVYGEAYPKIRYDDRKQSQDIHVTVPVNLDNLNTKIEGLQEDMDQVIKDLKVEIKDFVEYRHSIANEIFTQLILF